MFQHKLLFLFFLLMSIFTFSEITAPKKPATFKVIGFYTAKHDQAHISFVHEANKYFTEIAEKNHFQYDSTNNWNNLNQEFLSKYQVLIFLDTRPETPEQRIAFQQYIENGGAWLGFHFSAFALNNSTYPQNWDWYHEKFLGSGEYKSNTWRPTSAILSVENAKHPTSKHLPKTFKSAPNEWYRWTNDLRKNPSIEVLIAIHPNSFPLGTGPKAHEIWHSGDYPVAWTNKKYKMIYVNMGHNDIDYEHGTNADLSNTFQNSLQNQFILNALLWLGKH
jgi:hypothetical protein